MQQAALRLDNWGIRKVVEAPLGVEVLSVSDNRLKALGAVRTCTSLLELNLSGNKFEEAALLPLAGFHNLRVLDVSRNRLQSLGRLFQRTASLVGDNAQPFPRLEVLNASDNPALTDITPALGCQNLRILQAAGIAAVCLACSPCAKLELLDLDRCTLAVVDQLSMLSSLRSLMLNGNALLPGSGVLETAHPSLETLRIANNAIQEAPPLKLPSLTTLDLSSNQLLRLPPFAGTSNLTSLSLSGNSLASLAALAPLRSLRFLDASRNALLGLDISLAMGVLQSLLFLDVSANKIEDLEDVLSVLIKVDYPRLEHLDLRDNPLTFAFYPEASYCLPKWTCDAAMTLDALRNSDSGLQLDMDTQADLANYRSMLAMACHSLCTLDGLIIASQERSRPTERASQASSPVHTVSTTVQATQAAARLMASGVQADLGSPEFYDIEHIAEARHGNFELRQRLQHSLKEVDEVVFSTPRMSTESVAVSPQQHPAVPLWPGAPGRSLPPGTPSGAAPSGSLCRDVMEWSSAGRALSPGPTGRAAPTVSPSRDVLEWNSSQGRALSEGSPSRAAAPGFPRRDVLEWNSIGREVPPGSPGRAAPSSSPRSDMLDSKPGVLMGGEVSPSRAAAPGFPRRDVLEWNSIGREVPPGSPGRPAPSSSPRSDMLDSKSGVLIGGDVSRSPLPKLQAHGGLASSFSFEELPPLATDVVRAPFDNVGPDSLGRALPPSSPIRAAPAESPPRDVLEWSSAGRALSPCSPSRAAAPGSPRRDVLEWISAGRALSPGSPSIAAAPSSQRQDVLEWSSPCVEMPPGSLGPAAPPRSPRRDVMESNNSLPMGGNVSRSPLPRLQTHAGLASSFSFEELPPAATDVVRTPFEHARESRILSQDGFEVRDPEFRDARSESFDFRSRTYSTSSTIAGAPSLSGHASLGGSPSRSAMRDRFPSCSSHLSKQGVGRSPVPSVLRERLPSQSSQVSYQGSVGGSTYRTPIRDRLPSQVSQMLDGVESVAEEGIGHTMASLRFQTPVRQTPVPSYVFSSELKAGHVESPPEPAVAEALPGPRGGVKQHERQREYQLPTTQDNSGKLDGFRQSTRPPHLEDSSELSRSTYRGGLRQQSSFRSARPSSEWNIGFAHHASTSSSQAEMGAPQPMSISPPSLLAGADANQLRSTVRSPGKGSGSSMSFCPPFLLESDRASPHIGSHLDAGTMPVVGSHLDPRAMPVAGSHLDARAMQVASGGISATQDKRFSSDALTSRHAYLKFLENEIVAQRAFQKVQRSTRRPTPRDSRAPGRFVESHSSARAFGDPLSWQALPQEANWTGSMAGTACLKSRLCGTWTDSSHPQLEKHNARKVPVRRPSKRTTELNREARASEGNPIERRARKSPPRGAHGSSMVWARCSSLESEDSEVSTTDAEDKRGGAGRSSSQRGWGHISDSGSEASQTEPRPQSGRRKNAENAGREATAKSGRSQQDKRGGAGRSSSQRGWAHISDSESGASQAEPRPQSGRRKNVENAGGAATARSGRSQQALRTEAAWSSRREHKGVDGATKNRCWSPAEEENAPSAMQSSEHLNSIITGPLLISEQPEPLTVTGSAARSSQPGNLIDVYRGLAEVQEFSRRVPAVPSDSLRNVRITETEGPDVVTTTPRDEVEGHFPEGKIAPVALHRNSTNSFSKEKVWHAVITAASPEARQSLEQLIAQQTWAVPGRPVMHRYFLLRAVQTKVAAAQDVFRTLIVRDAARADVSTLENKQQQRAFFCGDAAHLDDVIASPFGFASIFEGMVLLFAFDLRHAEALSARCNWSPCDCGASAPPKLVSRALVAELALGCCHTSEVPLQEAMEGIGKGAHDCCGVPMGPTFDKAYRSGADSLYFPKSGVLAVLDPMRALPLFLLEYRRERIRIPSK